MIKTHKTIAIELESINLNEKIRSRVNYDPVYLNNLILSFQKGIPVPPISVVSKDSKYILADGYYRYKAAQMAGKNQILAISQTGRDREAATISCRINNNKIHPEVLKRSNKCKRKAIAIWMKYIDKRTSTRDLVRFLGISGPTITTIRKDVSNQERKEKSKNKIKPRRKGSRKRSALPPEIKRDLASLKREIEIKHNRQWNTSIREELLDRLGFLYNWVDNDLQGESNDG